MLNDKLNSKVGFASSYIPKILTAAAFAVISLYSVAMGETKHHPIKNNVTQEPLANARVVIGENKQDTLYTNSLGILHYPVYNYLPGDINISNGTWPPSLINSDVTYLVNYFRQLNNGPKFCPDYWPAWLHPDSLPDQPPENWPNCD